MSSHTAAGHVTDSVRNLSFAAFADHAASGVRNATGFTFLDHCAGRVGNALGVAVRNAFTDGVRNGHLATLLNHTSAANLTSRLLWAPDFTADGLAGALDLFNSLARQGVTVDRTIGAGCRSVDTFVDARSGTGWITWIFHNASDDRTGNIFFDGLPVTTVNRFVFDIGDRFADGVANVFVAGLGGRLVTSAADLLVAGVVNRFADGVADIFVAGVVDRLVDGVANRSVAGFVHRLHHFAGHRAVASLVDRPTNCFTDFTVAGLVDRTADRVVLAAIAGRVDLLLASHWDLLANRIVNRLVGAELLIFPDRFLDDLIAASITADGLDVITVERTLLFGTTLVTGGSTVAGHGLLPLPKKEGQRSEAEDPCGAFHFTSRL